MHPSLTKKKGGVPRKAISRAAAARRADVEEKRGPALLLPFFLPPVRRLMVGMIGTFFFSPLPSLIDLFETVSTFFFRRWDRKITRNPSSFQNTDPSFCHLFLLLSVHRVVPRHPDHQHRPPPLQKRVPNRQDGPEDLCHVQRCEPPTLSKQTKPTNPPNPFPPPSSRSTNSAKRPPPSSWSRSTRS